MITGLSGSGKTTARRHAERSGYTTVSLGDAVRRAYTDRGGDESTAAFVARTHETMGKGQFAREAVTRLDRRLADEAAPAGVVVEGVHSTAAARVVRERLGHTPLVYVWAPLSTRLARLRRREGRRSAHALLRRDLRELNGGLDELSTPLGHDHRVRNDHTRARFERRLDDILE